ncbi:formate/nitrite transporter family protein [uncultured Enterovirga sp.]|uniref:formate/nitrite transporter family protein n=1 Tax=uncultured Enterovirga sp. TaxID=2026352 RepID=UPI0035CC5F94
MYEPTIVHFAEVSRDKAKAMDRSPLGFFVGAMFAGAYIGMAMILALSAAEGLPPGVRPLILGATFGVGLILTIFAGAELFTGYVMYTGFGLARRGIGWVRAVQMLVVVWIGNLGGALILAWVFMAGGGGVALADGGAYLNTYVTHKVEADATALIARAVLCNWLVCLAIWTATRVAGDAAKCIVLGWVLMAFVAAGFEHSVANMTALSLGLLDPQPAISFVGALRNLLWVTIGNIGGGLVFVVGGYLAAARTDTEGPALHDARPLPTSIRPDAIAPAQ